MRATACPRRVPVWCLAFALGLASVWPCRADIVVNTAGRRFEGQIIRETPAGVTLQMPDGSQVVIPTQSIRTIERAARWENLVQFGERHLAQGNPQAAVARFEEALQAGPPSAEAAAIRARLAAAQQALTAQVSAERANEIRTVAELLARAETQRLGGDFSDALKTLDEAERMGPTDEQRAQLREQRIQTLWAQAYSFNDRHDPTGALATLEELFALDPTHQEGLDLYNQIIEAQPLDSPQTVAEIERILETNPGRADLHARVGEYYSRRRDYERALPHLIAAAESPQLEPQVRGRLRRAMLHAVETASRAGDYMRAVELYEEFLTRFPTEDQGYLDLLIYHYQDHRLAPDDLDGRARLAQQCRAAGYDDWAREQMQRVLEQDPNHAGALALQREFAEEEFAEASEFLRLGNLPVAVGMFQALIEKYNYPDLAEQAEVQMADAQRRLREEARQRTEQAQRLVEQGDQYAAVAEQNINFLRQFQLNERQPYTIRGLSTRNEIVTNLRRAILCYEGALDLDPRLGPISGGGVSVKLADARDRLAAFTNPRLPRYAPSVSRQ